MALAEARRNREENERLRRECEELRARVGYYEGVESEFGRRMQRVRQARVEAERARQTQRQAGSSQAQAGPSRVQAQAGPSRAVPSQTQARRAPAQRAPALGPNGTEIIDDIPYTVVQEAALGPNGTEVFDEDGRRVFVHKQKAFVGDYWRTQKELRE